jgi:hypothetical protein
MFTDESQEVSPETETEQVEETVEEVTETEEPQTDWEHEAKKWKGIAQRNLSKAEKVTESTPETSLSAKDILAVSKAGIEPEDLDEVIEYAKFKNIPIHEALKSSVVKATIAEKTELRRSADATNTSSARRASSQISDERLLSDAEKGELPDSDADMKRLVALQLKARRG